VQFDNIRKDLTTTFKATKSHYFDNSFSIYPGEENPTYKNVTLLEKDLPIEVIAAGKVYINLIEGDVTTIEVDSIIRLDFEKDMDKDTMTTDNIKILGPGDEELHLDIVNDTGSYRRWRLVPREGLGYNTHYTLTVGEGVAESGGSINPLWRDLIITFKTESLANAAVNGKVTINEKGVEEVDIHVYHEGTHLKSGKTELNGYYLIDLEMSELELYPITIVANGSALGLTEDTLEMKTLRSGVALNDTDFELDRIPDWIQVIYPKDDKGRMLVDGAITIRFKEELERSDLASFVQNFTLGSPPEEIDLTVSEDGLTVTIEPVEPLDHDSSYSLFISNFQDGEFYRELMTVSGSKALIRGETIEILTELKPITVILQQPIREEIEENNVTLSSRIYLFFTNYTVVKSLVESNIVIKSVYNDELVGNLIFNWATTGKGVGIDHDDFDSLTEYEIYLPAGEYGENGAKIKEPFLLHFVTEAKEDPFFKPIEILPTEPQEAGLISIQAENSKGRPVRVIVTAVPANNPNAAPEEIVNFILNELESKQVNFDFTGKEDGEYKIIITANDLESNWRINEYEMNLVIGKKGDDGGSDFPWLILIIIIAVILIVLILGVYLYLQSRGSTIEEELKEEFECPECHNLVGSDDTVCPHCGAEFEEEAYKCPKCGNMMDPDDEECPECGYDFSDQAKMELDEDEDDDISEMYEEEDDMELDEDEDIEMDEEEEELDELDDDDEI
jgi:RNA polymerase subunit RPABC4/transcription elongation factor Spt4